MAMSGLQGQLLRLSIMNICDFHPRPRASLPSQSSPSAVSPRLIRHWSSSCSVLVDGELKHIRPALDSGSIANGVEGGRIRRTLSALEGTGQPFKSSSNPEAFSEYYGYPFGTSPGNRLPNGERRTLLWENTTEFVESLL